MESSPRNDVLYVSPVTQSSGSRMSAGKGPGTCNESCTMVVVIDTGFSLPIPPCCVDYKSSCNNNLVGIYMTVVAVRSRPALSEPVCYCVLCLGLVIYGYCVGGLSWPVQETTSILELLDLAVHHNPFPR